MREAYDLHRKAEQDEEAARRLGKGPAAEMEALGRLNAAAAVLARYQAPLQEATAAKETAQALADDAVMGVQAAEEARDAAVWGYEHPGYIPLSGETVNIPAQPLTRFSLGLDLDNKTELSPVDRMLAALPGWSMAVLAGLVKEAENKARIAERKAIAGGRGQEAACFRGYGPRAGRAGGPRWRLLAGGAALVNVAAARQSHPEWPPCAVREPRRVPAPRPASRSSPACAPPHTRPRPRAYPSPMTRIGLCITVMPTTVNATGPRTAAPPTCPTRTARQAIVPARANFTPLRPLPKATDG